MSVRVQAIVEEALALLREGLAVRGGLVHRDSSAASPSSPRAFAGDACAQEGGESAEQMPRRLRVREQVDTEDGTRLTAFSDGSVRALFSDRTTLHLEPAAPESVRARLAVFVSLYA